MTTTEHPMTICPQCGNHAWQCNCKRIKPAHAPTTMKNTYRIENANGARLTNSKEDGWVFRYRSSGASWRKRSSAESHFAIARAASRTGQIFLRTEPDDASPTITEEIKP